MPTPAERKALAQGLAKLRENMVTLAELSEIAIRKAMDCLARGDPVVAGEVFTLDEEIYALQLEIERTCGDLIALHAPVARDLRTITTSLKITTDLDRIGRYAKDIAEVALQVHAETREHLEGLVGIQRMAELTIQMVDKATDAFVKRDAESVRRIAEVDDAVDLLHDEILRGLIGSMEAGRTPIEDGVWYILVNRYLERIADHAVNIGERVVYMVTAERLPRVRGAERAPREAP